MYAISHVMLAAGKVDADDLMAVGALTAATSAAASPGMGQRILQTLLAMKDTSMIDLVMADSGPEAMIMVSGVSGPVEDHCDEDCGMFMFNQPGLDASQGDGEDDGGMSQSASPSWTAIQFVCGLVRYGPERQEKAAFTDAEDEEAGLKQLEDSHTDESEDLDPEFNPEEVSLMPIEFQLREVLQEWASSEHKDLLADGSAAKMLEVVVIEICLGLISGAVLGKIHVSTTDSEEDEDNSQGQEDDSADEDMAGSDSNDVVPTDISWILEILSAGYETAEMSKGNLWASAFASAARITANAVIVHEENGDAEMQVAASEALTSIVKMAEKLTSSWKGTQPNDTRHVSLMTYMIDNIVQAEVLRKSGQVLEGVKAAPRSPEQLLTTPPTPEAMASINSARAGTSVDAKRSQDVLSEALFTIMDVSVTLVAAAARHSRQAVRATGAALAVTVIDVMNNGPMRDHERNVGLSSQMITTIQQTLQTSTQAVMSATSDGTSTHADNTPEASLFAETIASEPVKASTVMSSDSLPESGSYPTKQQSEADASQDGDLGENEASIGFTALFVAIMRTVNLEQCEQTQALVADLVSWSLNAQVRIFAFRNNDSL